MKILLSTLLFLLSLHTYAQIDSPPSIGVRRSFGVWLLQPNLRGDVYEVSGKRFISPSRLALYIQASGDIQATAMFEQFQRDRRKAHLFGGVGGTAAIGGPVLFMASILTAAGFGPTGRSADARWMAYSSIGLTVGGVACAFAGKKHHRHAYELLHLSIDRYNAGLGVRVTKSF